ncbi:unnamed protein product [Zymoseptoria tritici ST99CH_3D1]|nr:unnamed protein product [Zymoseptoria tritici ST99CH_3D1]
MLPPESPTHLRGYRTPPQRPSPLVEAVMERLGIRRGRCVSKSTSKQETRCTRFLGARPNTLYPVSCLVEVMQQPTIVSASTVHAYLMLVGVASCKDHPLGQHDDQTWFLSHLLKEIWTIHECIRSRGAADAPKNPASLLHLMESEPAAPPAFLPTYNDPPFAGPPGRVRARAAANREHSRRHFRDVGRL